MAETASNLLYPVYVYDDGIELPESGTYFVVAGNGTWMHKDTGIVSGFLPVGQVSFLKDLDASAEVRCRMPKIPARLVWRIQNFFRMVVEKHHSECEVNIYYSKSRGDFKVHVPEQHVSHGSVHYRGIGTNHRPGIEDYLCVGTIHSHCDFGAFHSGTDVGDEEDFDGIHVTFGHNNQTEFSISASVVVNGHRERVEPTTLLEGIEPAANDRFRLLPPDSAEEWSEGLDDWLNEVHGPARHLSWADLLRERVSKTLAKDDDGPISAGDKVTWAGDLKSVQLKTVCGEGPFEVLSADDKKLTIKTLVGKAKFSKALFKKAD